jgi:hypothetical protein
LNDTIDGTAAPAAEEPKSIVKAPSAALVAAGFGDAKGQGTEGLTNDDVRPPRLTLAQSGSPQTKRGNVKFIEGVHEGDLFNDLSGEKYGIGPLEFTVIRFLGLRAVEFWPQLKPGEVGPQGIKDFNVPTARDKNGDFKDARLNWTEENGVRVKPKATLFYEYLVFLPATQEVVALAFKNTQLKVAKNLNSMIKLPLRVDGELVVEPPAWARLFALGTTIQSRKDGSLELNWANFTLAAKGIAPREVRDQSAALYEAFSRKNVIIEHEAESARSDDDVPF